jgi:hypothetical protein
MVPLWSTVGMYEEMLILLYNPNTTQWFVFFESFCHLVKRTLHVECITNNETDQGH